MKDALKPEAAKDRMLKEFKRKPGEGNAFLEEAADKLLSVAEAALPSDVNDSDRAYYWAQISAKAANKIPSAAPKVEAKDGDGRDVQP